jgi:hypothetical protein
MKIVLWWLLALNGLAAAVWLSGFDWPAASRPEPAAPTLAAKRLELLSELPSLPPRIDEQSEMSAHRGDGPDAVAQPVTEPPVPETSAADAPGAPTTDTAPPAPPVPGAPQGEPLADAASAAPQAATEGPETASAPAMPSAALDDGATASTPSALGTTSVTDANVAAEQDAPVCHRTAAVAPEAKDRIGAAVRGAKLGEPVLKSSLRPRYWVYWSGASADASSVEEALKSAGVKDWYRVGGASKAMISLGVYGQDERARRRQRELAAKAIQATVEQRYPATARLRWQITARPSSVAAAAADLARAGVRLERCP